MGERRGRKQTHGNPLPDVEATAAMRVLKAVRTRERWSDAETRRRFEGIEDQSKMLALSDEESRNAEFHIDAATFRKILSCDIRVNHEHKWGIYLWMREYYGNELQINILEETLRQKEQLLHSFNRLLGFDELNTEMTQTLVGSYNLYRPLYSDPSRKILVQRFVVGSNASVFDCELSGTYEASPGKIVQDRFEGKIVPQGERATAILRIPVVYKGVMIVHFDDLDINAGGAGIASMSGVMLTAIGSRRASAWPFFADRVDPKSPIAASIVPKDEARHLPERVVQALDRGAVHWSSSHYPRPFSKPA